MQVVNLISWSGHNFSYLPGDVIDLPDDVAEARVTAGLADYAPVIADTGTAPAGRGKRAGA